jgi:hypothetical protein
MEFSAKHLTVPVIALLSLVAVSCSSPITSEVKGSKSPPTRTCELGERVEVENGGFRIVQKCVSEGNLIVGDGRGEVTTWEFHFSDEDDIDLFRDGCWVRSAILEIQLEPTGNTIDDSLRVRGKWELGLEEIQSLEPGSVQKVEIDLMERGGRPSPYTPPVIRSLILEEPEARLQMLYEFDAIVSWAKLTIDCDL